MFSSNYTNRLFGRTRGRSKKKINLKKYYETVDKYKFQNFNEKLEYILGMNYRNYRILIGSSNQDDINNIKIKDNRIETYLIENNIVKNLNINYFFKKMLILLMNI